MDMVLGVHPDGDILQLNPGDIGSLGQLFYRLEIHSYFSPYVSSSLNVIKILIGIDQMLQELINFNIKSDRIRSRVNQNVLFY